MSRVLALLALVVVLSACGDGPDADGHGGTPAPGGDAATAEGPAPGTTDTSSVDPVDPGGTPVALEVVGEGFEQPVAVLLTPSDRLVVVEQAGRLTAIDGEVLLDLTDLVFYGGERGLLDAVAHADEERLFVHHTGRDGQTVLAEYRWDGDAVDADSRTVLFTHPQPASNHNGGSVVLLPDGTLLLALGDGGRAGDAFDQAQDTTTPLGGLLRFDVSTPGTAEPAGAGFDEPALWAYGLRNPWRIAVDDDALYVADVGQDAVEEVSVVALSAAEGANFGWPLVEGDRCFAEDPCDGDFVPSVVNLRHEGSNVCSITGGVVYRGSAIPALVGTYLYSDVCGGFLRGVVVTDGAVTAELDLTDQVTVRQVVGFGTDADGELLLTQLTGEVLRLVPA